jgi:hypothetical protein
VWRAPSGRSQKSKVKRQKCGVGLRPTMRVKSKGKTVRVESEGKLRIPFIQPTVSLTSYASRSLRASLRAGSLAPLNLRSRVSAGCFPPHLAFGHPLPAAGARGRPAPNVGPTEPSRECEAPTEHQETCGRAFRRRSFHAAPGETRAELRAFARLSPVAGFRQRSPDRIKPNMPESRSGQSLAVRRPLRARPALPLVPPSATHHSRTIQLDRAPLRTASNCVELRRIQAACRFRGNSTSLNMPIL